MKEKAEDGGVLGCIEWALLVFQRAHRNGSWGLGQSEETGCRITGEMVRNTWDVIVYPQELRQENGRGLGENRLGRYREDGGMGGRKEGEEKKEGRGDSPCPSEGSSPPDPGRGLREDFPEWAHLCPTPTPMCERTWYFPCLAGWRTMQSKPAPYLGLKGPEDGGLTQPCSGGPASSPPHPA